MHLGEANVAEEDLSEFLEVAEDLKIRGLSKESLNSSVTRNNEQNKIDLKTVLKRDLHDVTNCNKI